jgi:multiple sugar transport system substrate-binding protein
VAAPEDSFQFSGLIPEIRDRVIRYGGEVVAMPLGTSALVLAYRRDAFERPENLEAAKAAGLALEPPETYEQLDALARFFHGRDWDGDGQAESGIALALADDPEGVAEAIFLARAAALGAHPDYFSLFFDDRTLAARIASPPFAEALAGLVALKASSNADTLDFDITRAREAFRDGQAALLIDVAEQAPSWSDPKRPVPTGVAPLPGSPRVYDPRREVWQDLDRPNRPAFLLDGGGWLVGVAASSDAIDPARDLVRHLVGPDGAERLAASRILPLLPVRGSLLGGDRIDPRLDIRGLGRAVSRTLMADRLLPGPRLPGQEQYRADLARARASALQGRSVDEALGEAARAWETFTDTLGRERQRWHERRSLNQPTPATPPPDPPPAS